MALEKVKVRCHGCARINLLLVKIEAPGAVLVLSEAERFECAWCGWVHQPGYEFWLMVDVAPVHDGISPFTRAPMGLTDVWATIEQETQAGGHRQSSKNVITREPGSLNKSKEK